MFLNTVKEDYVIVSRNGAHRDADPSSHSNYKRYKTLFFQFSRGYYPIRFKLGQTTLERWSPQIKQSDLLLNEINEQLILEL